MGIADEILGPEDERQSPPGKGGNGRDHNADPFTIANDLDPAEVLDWLGIEREGKRIKSCPGCRASSGVDLIRHGWKCQHESCKDKGKNGFRTNIDSVMEVRGVTHTAAVNLIAEQFGFRGVIPKVQRNSDGHSTTEPRGKEPHWPTPDQRVDVLRTPAVRMPLGIDPLDKRCRGGVPSGRIIVLVAEPGGCKTTIAVQMGEYLRAHGAYVAFAAYDEEADSLLIRMGQMIGLARQELEQANEHALAQLRRHVAEPQFMLVDGCGDEDTWLSVIISALLVKAAAAGKPPVLVVDSIQTALEPGGDVNETARARVDRIVRVLKYARTRGVLVIATSEANRGFYRQRDGRINALAAAKESGSIEYQSTVLLVLDPHDSDDGTDDRVAVYVPKNRIGEKAKNPFWLKLDKETASVSPCEAPESDDGEESTPRAGSRGAKRREARRRKCAIALEEWIAQHPGANTRMLRDGIDGFGSKAVDEARDWLKQAGRIEDTAEPSERGNFRGCAWRLTDFAVAHPLEDDDPCRG